MVKNKRVLFIGTTFYTYHTMIIKEFEAQGFIVDYYPDRPSERSITKGLIKINKNLVKKQTEAYFDEIINETRGKHYDKVFMINCKVYTKNMVEELKSMHKTAEFILYLWDSVKLYPFVEDLIPLFDRAYTFDLDDSEKKYGLKLLPLFYHHEYAKIAEEKHVIKYDLVSICTAHPVRYRIIKELFPKLRNEGIRIYSFLFINKLQYIYNKVFVNQFWLAKKSEFNFKSLRNDEIIEIIKESNTIFDIPHEKQSGLTMRTIETLGAKRKLITTNKQISRYNFYNENNIMILNDDNFEEVASFLKRDYQDIPKHIYKAYSLSSWVTNIIEGITINFAR
ncbi:MAG: hypothetical protein WBI17_03820 [Clostridiaceae bacterium]